MIGLEWTDIALIALALIAVLLLGGVELKVKTRKTLETCPHCGKELVEGGNQ